MSRVRAAYLYGEAAFPTAFAVRCPVHGLVYLTAAEHDRQLDLPFQRWTCPRVNGADALCAIISTWDGEVDDS
jgi:hypothetical protein